MIIQSTSRSRSGSKYKDCDTNYSTKGTLRWDHFFVFCRQLQMFAFEINGGKQKCFHTEQIHPLHIHVKITKYGFLQHSPKKWKKSYQEEPSSGAALLHQARNAFNLCKTVKAFWRQMCCLMSKILVSVSFIALPKKKKKKDPKHTAEKSQEWLRAKPEDGPADSEVTYYEPWSKSYWTSPEGAETCRLEKAPIKPQTSAAVKVPGDSTRSHVDSKSV